MSRGKKSRKNRYKYIIMAFGDPPFYWLGGVDGVQQQQWWQTPQPQFFTPVNPINQQPAYPYSLQQLQQSQPIPPPIIYVDKICSEQQQYLQRLQYEEQQLGQISILSIEEVKMPYSPEYQQFYVIE